MESDPAVLSEQFSDEWLTANLFGGYASSTVACVNTRTYHGLLVSASTSGGKRIQLVNTLEEKVVFGNEEHYLSTHRYVDAFYPDGIRRLMGFGQEGNTVWWAYKLGSHILLKKFSFGREQEGFSLEYSSKEPFRAEVRPLISVRTHHAVIRAGQKSYEVVEDGDGNVSIREASTPLTLKMKIRDGQALLENYWYYNFFYGEEAERGSACVEDLYSPCALLAEGERVAIDFWVEPQRRQTYGGRNTPLLNYLAFDPKPLVVAGYYWFWDWCRDSMIVLPTLFEETGDGSLVEAILEKYFEAMVDGFLPTGFGEEGKPFYNSVDTSLWAAYAIHRLCELASSYTLASKFLSKLEAIKGGYEDGAMFGVKLVGGLVYHEAKGATWMDAYYEGIHYTPRNGFAVEVNSLWLLLLKLISKAKQQAGDVGQLAEEIQKFKEAFNAKFSSPFGLYDTLNSEMRPVDHSEIRPNMLFALSLHEDLVDPQTAKKVLDAATKELLTPYGLRTLNPGHKSYRPKYLGDRASRDAAYHNGTVWPWLLGAYVDAHLKFDQQKLGYIACAEAPLLRLAEKRNYLVNEVFDAEPPHKPRGCVSQAWSTAEILRVTRILRIGVQAHS